MTAFNLLRIRPAVYENLKKKCRKQADSDREKKCRERERERELKCALYHPHGKAQLLLRKLLLKEVAAENCSQLFEV